MTKTQIIHAIALLLLTVTTLRAASDPLSTLHPAHPRLMLLDTDIPRLKSLIQSDPTAKDYFSQIQSAGDQLLTAPVSTRILVGPRLLTTSREVLRRTSTLGSLYLLTGDHRYSDRCRQEMLAVAQFKDWNPSHFLDVAEMTNALALGYDWTYDTLSPQDRTTIRNAIINLGLKEGLKVYASSDKIPNPWPIRTNNWNQVCNGGLTVGALAVADESPDISRQIIEAARASIPLAMSQFAPDGGCVEGPGYWAYATQYTVYYLASLHTALNTDFGFLSSPGFSQTGTFRIQSMGPTHKTFNFADAHDGITPAPQMFWLATAFNEPAYAAHERSLHTHPDAFALLWYTPAGSQSDIDRLQTSALYKRINVAFLRTGAGPSASFVGLKGGDNSASHAHLDLGTFVYDTAGLRWAIDLGPDDYNLPAYFGKDRWTYYRLRTEGHNTLTLDHQNQSPKATAKIIAFSPQHNVAIIDLSYAYGNNTHALRLFQLFNNGSLLIQDELTTTHLIQVTWNLHTNSQIQISPDGHFATLTQSGKTLTAHLLQPTDAQFSIAPSDPPPSTQSTVPTGPPRKPSQKLIVNIPEKVENLNLAIELTPTISDDTQPAIHPINDWLKKMAQD